ncbi:MAG TPA: FHA domain-containing protein [Anaerolineales bacterium]|nr:FHA domain-containing protein [Anaerolineales bacterium]
MLLSVCLVLFPLVFQTASAQEGGVARLAPIETAAFPLLTTYLDVRDATGSFVYGLEADDVTILENGVQVPVQEMVLLRPGTQFVLAIGPGESLTIRDSQGKTRYEYLIEAIEAWSQARSGSTLDDLSFLPSGSPEITHQTGLESWLATIKSYLLISQESLPGFDVLGRALEVAADPTRRPGMGRVVLFVTTLPGRDVTEELQSLAARANQRGVRVFVWLVGSPEQFGTQEAAQLGDLAALTGGSLFAFSGQEEIPDLEVYLEPLRNAYYLTYTSRIKSSGTHQISAVVENEAFEASSPAQQFDLVVLPPTVAFISPPTNIVREVPEDSAGTQALLPQSQSLEIMIEFPDGYPRSPIRSTLYADGLPVEENTSEPFNTFQWDLSGYSSTGEHLIRAEAVDSLDLKGASADIPVIITVKLPVVRTITSFSGNGMMLAGLSVLVAASVLALALILGGRLRPGTLLHLRRKRRRIEPTSQPIEVNIEPVQARQSRWMNRLHWPQRQVAPKPLASLVRLSEMESGDTAPPIAITSSEVTFGSDPAEASIVLVDPSVEPLHARLYRDQDGSFRLTDCASTAGTWVNLSPVSADGTRLEHGDRIHVGQVNFQFLQKEPERIRKPVVHIEVPPS